jgi:hypothetical protein
MKPSDEMLMAYADDELDAEGRASVEAAMAVDPEIAKRVARHKALRGALKSQFEPVLREPVPDRLLTAVRKTPAAQPRKAEVTDLARVRAAKQQTAEDARRWSWPEWGGMAASLVLGLAVGYLLLRPPGQMMSSSDGRLIAQGALKEALSRQLAGEQAGELPVQIGLSFVAKTGHYCRAFATHSTESMAGIACREGDEWSVKMLAPSESTKSGANGYRMAGTALPSAVTQAVGEQIEGDPLDAAGEVAARDSGWQR